MEYILDRVERDLTTDLPISLKQITDDDQAIEMCRKGHRQAYGFLVNRYMQRAYFCALGFVGSHDAALDLSQDAFVRAYRAINRFEPGRQFFTWYYKILRNLCLNFIRDKKLHARSFSEVSEYEIARLSDDRLDADRAVEREELVAKVWTAIDELKPWEREIILLKDFQDYAYKEIAETLEIPIGTVMSRLFNARKSLKAKLERIYP